MGQARAHRRSRSTGGRLMRHFRGAAFFTTLWRILKGLPLALVTPPALGLAAAALAACDLVCLIRHRKPLPASTTPDTRSASIVIPNWNGRELLKKYLPSVI